MGAERKNIGTKEIGDLTAGETIWDARVKGFGARRQKGDAVSYFLYYRTKEGRQRWHTIGRHGSPWTPTQARDEARRVLGKVASGDDPSGERGDDRKAETVFQLCDLYLADAEAGRLLTKRKAPKKPSTLNTDRGRIERHVKPLLGARKVAAVTREDVEAFMYDVAEGKTAATVKTGKHGLARVTGGKGTAARTVGLLGAIFAYAVKRRMRVDNPVANVGRFADGHRSRRMTDDEYAALGDALRKASAEAIWPPAVACVHLLALTGWRSGEALTLSWMDLDFARRTAFLRDTKTGESMRLLSRVACDVASGLDRLDTLVFPSTRGKNRMAGFPKLWARIAKLGGLSGEVTPHVLRHSFASLAADLNYSDATIANLIGHKRHSVTSRYVHSADPVLLAAADAIAAEISRRMGFDVEGANVIPFAKARA
jgi:integrase